MRAWLRWWRRCPECHGRLCPVYAAFGEPMPESPAMLVMHRWR